MAASNEIQLISQLTDGSDVQSANDWFMVDRESPEGTGNYVQRKISAQKAINGVLGTTNLTESFNGSALSNGTYYLFGSYTAPAADANLSNASPTQTLGTASIMYGAYAFIVCGGVGSTDAGVVELEASGTSITDSGVLTGSDTEVILADITASTVVTNAYFQTSKKWVGQVTFTLQGASGSPTTFSLDFNYGFANYQPANGLTFDLFEAKGNCKTNINASDFDLIVYEHPTNADVTWTYSAAGFTPGGTELFRMSDVASTNTALLAATPFNFKRSSIGSAITNGFVCQVFMGTTNGIDYMNVTVGIK